MATDLDIVLAAADIYAESLFELASESNEADAIGEELENLAQLWKRDPAFAGLMSSLAIDDGARRESIKKIFGGGRVNRLIFNLLMVLNDKRRPMILPQVAEAYRKKLNEHRGRRDVYVTSAAPLDEQLRTQIREQVRRLTGMEGILVERVDPGLLGGVTLQIGDRVYDTSVRRRLREMRGELLESVKRHLVGGLSRFVTEG
jgi:F-type H+-transporting ATPase subunit delta